MTRYRFSFWLDSRKSDEKGLHQLVNNLKAERQFTSAIRDGLRLICDLRAGNTDVLYELFPNLRPPVVINGGGGGDLQEIKAMLEIVVSQQSSGGYQMKSVKPATQLRQNSDEADAPRALDVPKLAMPVFDDDDDMPTLVIQKSSDTSASANLLKAMSNLF